VKIEEIPQFLGRIRTDRAAWSEVEYAQASSGEDINAPTRNACLRGLQHDRRADDRELTVFLLEQEVRDCYDGGCGYGDSLFLAIYLVACLDEVDLAWLIMKAKIANFDTLCGVNIEALYSCGVERTQAMLKASRRKEGKHFLPAPSQTNVDNWWKRQRDRFPARWEDEIDKANICAAIGDFDAAADYLRKQLAASFAKVEPGSDQERELLVNARYRWGSLGRHDEAALVQKKIDAYVPDDPRKRASQLQDALTTYTAAGELREAASRIEPLRTALLQVDGWHEVGLGRMSAESMLDLGLAASDVAVSEQTFSIVEELLSLGLRRPSVILLEKLVALATRLARQDRAAYYQRRVRAKRRKIG
jgi:tetratricopeptide (TPR) repeat protein